MARKARLFAALLAISMLLATAGSAAGQEPIQLWGEPRISIVWPHDGHGNPTPVEESRMVNVSVWPSNPVPCCRDPGISLFVAKDNEPTRVIESYGRVQVIERTVGGITFATAQFNSIPADLVAEPTARYRFIVRGSSYSNVWVHAADPRTILPEPVVPTGYRQPQSPYLLDARIQVVWPHDERGQFRPVAEAPLVNVAVDLFAHGTLDSVPLDYEPDHANLLVAEGNEPLAVLLDPQQVTYAQRAQKITYTANGQTFPRWVFNNVPVEPGQQYHFAPSVIPPMNKAFASNYFTVWTHAADARTLLPNPEPPRSSAP